MSTLSDLSTLWDVCLGLKHNCTMLLALGIKGFDSLLTEENATTIFPITTTIQSENVIQYDDEMSEFNEQSTLFDALVDIRNSSNFENETVEAISDITTTGSRTTNLDISPTFNTAATAIEILDLRNNTSFDVEATSIETVNDLEGEFSTTMSTILEIEAFSTKDTPTHNMEGEFMSTMSTILDLEVFSTNDTSDTMTSNMDIEYLSNTVSSTIVTMNSNDIESTRVTFFTYSTASDLQSSELETSSNMMLITSQPIASWKNFFDESNMTMIILIISLTTLILLTCVGTVYLLFKKKSKLECCTEYCYYKCWYQLCYCCDKVILDL